MRYLLVFSLLISMLFSCSNFIEDSSLKKVDSDTTKNKDNKVEINIWVSDITYIRTYQGWLYLTVIIDLFDRKVVGWAMSSDLTAQNTSITAFRMAVRNTDLSKNNNLIFHSDRGLQYACGTFTNIMNHYKITRSMSRKGNCWDNAVAESFFKTLKTEWVWQRTYSNRKTAELSIFQWIETWYNRKRRHSHLDYKTIEEFDNLFFNHNLAA